MSNLDKETMEILAKGEEINNFTNSTGWGIVKRNLLERAARLTDISSIDITTNSPEDLLIQIKVNRKASQELLDWLKDVEGSVELHKANKDAVKAIHNELIFVVD